MLKNPSKYEQRYLIRPNAFLSPVTPVLVEFPESSGGRIRSFPCPYHSTMFLHAHISPGA
jgi:hypothetical protein